MARKAPRNTRRKIVTAAWRLFYEQGYDSTTVDQIISASGTSKGSFYHYFSGKEALLSSLSSLFDDKYEELMDQIPADMHSFDALLFLNRELFDLIDNRIDQNLIAGGEEGINGLTLSNAMHLSAFLGQPVEIPFDEDLYERELKKRVATSRRKEGGASVFSDTAGTY